MKSPTNKPQLNDALKFLIACCQTELSKDDEQFILSYLSQITDHQSLITAASQHGILPLVYKTLKKIYEDDSSRPSLNSQRLTLNAALLNELKVHYQSIAQRNMLMSAELIRIMKLLEENGIEALAFKGPALAQMAYGDITLRQYSDLDILVEQKDLFTAGNLIMSSHYIPDEKIDFLKNEALLDISSDLGFRHVKNNTYIELHWKLFQKKLSANLDNLTISSNPAIIYIQNKPVKTLQTDLLLVYLCAHGSKHMWERMEWINDVDRFIRHSDTIDWDAVWNYAKMMRNINTLLLGLSLCKELLGTTLPTKIETEINKRNKIELLKVHTLQLFNQALSEQNSTIATMFKQFVYHTKLYDSFGDKVKYYISSIFKVTRADVLNVNLPRYLSFLYVIIRPFRLAKKYLTKN